MSWFWSSAPLGCACPAAQQLVRDVQRIPYKKLWSSSAWPPGSGTDAIDQCDPFQCRASFRTGATRSRFPTYPTAQQLSGDEQLTPTRTLLAKAPVPSGSGVDTADQLWPFQCIASFKVTAELPSLPSDPVAQQFVAEVHERPSSTLRSPLVIPPGSGTPTWDHFLPFQRSASLNKAPPGAMIPKVPTAQQFPAEAQRMALSALAPSDPVPPGFGVATRDQAVSFQCSAWFSIPSEPMALASVPYSPTAQQLSGEVHVTSISSLKSPLRTPPGVGVATSDQFLPFQCRASSSWTPCRS